MTTHKHEWKKSSRKHKRPPRFFVECACGAKAQAVLNNGYLHAFTTAKARHKLEVEIAELIARQVGWFNGWKASDEMFDKSCRKAARSVIKRLTKCASDTATPSDNEAALRK